MIVVRLSGGLGNQMFQYAFGFYLARKNNTDLKLDLTLLQLRKNKNQFNIYRNFELDKLTITSSFATDYQKNKFNPDPSLPVFKKIFFKIRNVFSPSLTYIQKDHDFIAEHLDLKKDICIVGRWQSELYFISVKDELKEHFQFKNKLDNMNEAIAGQIKKLNSVAIQVRRSDYVSNHEFAAGLGALNKQYYSDAIDIIRTKISNPHFFIFSEDTEWCRNNIVEENCTFVIQKDSLKSAEFDLHLMSLCKHHIISNSTFSWWGAWLSETSDSVIIAPEKWAKTIAFTPSHIVPERWIKIANNFE